MSIPQQDSFLPVIMNKPGSYLLHERYTPGSILQPREDAPKGKIWCNHCLQYLQIGTESVSHQNLVRPSAACTECTAWVFLDEQVPIAHGYRCASAGGDKVQYTVGGSQSRATKAPSRDATQEEAASWPHE